MVAQKPRQLALALPVEERLDLEDFLVGSSNEAAFAVIDLWPDWAEKVQILIGPPERAKVISPRFGQSGQGPPGSLRRFCTKKIPKPSQHRPPS